MKKILIVMQHFAPYRDATFQKLKESGKYQLYFLLTTGNLSHKEWRYEPPAFQYQQASNKFVSIGAVGRLYQDYVKLLKNYKPDIVILSGDLLAVVYTKIFYSKIKVIYMADTIRPGKSGEKKSNFWLLSKLYGMADGIWCTGKAGKKYFEYYTKGKIPIREGCYTNDTNIIWKRYLEVSKEEVRNQYKISDNEYVILFIGKLIRDRRVDRILEIAELLEKECLDIKVVIVGDGEKEDLVRQYQGKHKNLIYIQSVPVKELEKMYRMADLYMYLGWEPYSLALYEAAVVGLPIIAMQNVGAVYDCLESEVNGFSIREYNKEEILMKIKKAKSGYYNDGAKKISDFIKEKRGVAWAAKELEYLIQGEL